ncbi:hypothetical protein [Pectobacterium versatile]|uniref:Uncharacterized protein n=1 Tax=Pectobacterium versatile TaxID=2488639 RepID=A0A7T0HHU8_9GAMM|nr:hypothetical protein [Pectobacterium versatile]QPK17727.1 hypothetical protein F131LOC_010590 [Pectobacterium versatile]
MKSFKDSLLIAHLSSEDNFNSEDLYQINDSNVVPSSKKMELLSTIYYAVVNDFTLNENYGLDKYLSAEIRHIVFTTQLRSCFEKTNLVTSKKKWRLFKNNYWIGKYSYVNDQIIDNIDSLLRGFSEEIDFALYNINERFRVEIYDINSGNVFDYVAYHHRLVKISEICIESKTHEDF